MNRIAESYVKLALAAGRHDPDFVDAYYGPPAWQEAARMKEKSPEQIKRAALSLILELKELDLARSDHWGQLRHAHWLETYALMAPNRARQRLQFIDRYRSYVVNYNLGLDLVRKHIHALGGRGGKPERRWQEFQKLLSMPCLPSMLLR